MTPFNQVLRLWLRRAPLTERVVGVVAVVAVIGLLTWAIVPSESATEVTASGVVAGASPGAAPNDATSGGAPGTPAVETSSAAVGGAAGATAPSGAAGGAGAALNGPATSGSGPAAATCPAGTDRGVTNEEMKIAVSLIDVAGAAGNAAFGVPPAEEQRAAFEAVIENVNGEGGICGRQVVATFHPVNALDSSAGHVACLEMIAEEPFYVIDSGSLGPDEIPCFAQSQTPIAVSALSSQARDFYPHVFSLRPDDLVYRNAILAWQAMGALTDATIGVLYHPCFPETVEAIFAALRAAGVPDERVTSFDFGPCSGFASPATHQQAVLQFQQEGVTHIMPAFMTSDFGNFTKIAQSQGFRPAYLIPDYTAIATAYGALAPDWANIDGASAITNQAVGEEHTPSYQPSAETQRCDAIMTGAGLSPVYQQGVGYGGIACSQLWLLQAMVEHAPAMSRAALAEGLSAAGTVPLSYPIGPGDFTQPGTTWSGQYWRELRASADCRCFTVIDPAFRPAFP